MLAITGIILFGGILIAMWMRGSNDDAQTPSSSPLARPIEVFLDDKDYQKGLSSNSALSVQKPSPKPILDPQAQKSLALPNEDLPQADRIEEFFSTMGPKLPIVETIAYKSRVAWQKGRPAWLSDYAAHYNTSRHFIARSLNGKADYFKQDIAEGDKFNVLRKDKLIEFHLVIDISRCRMWFYYIDGDTHEKVLLKTYSVGLGRPDPSRSSGLLTPLGKYSLGNRIAIYKPTVIGHYKGQKIEMIRIFGTRWIPFEKEIIQCTAPAKGLGLHGVPWMKNAQGHWVQDLTSLGKYESDGCIRMASEDIEEIFAIIITKPSFIELVKNFSESGILKH